MPLYLHNSTITDPHSSLSISHPTYCPPVCLQHDQESPIGLKYELLQGLGAGAVGFDAHRPLHLLSVLHRGVVTGEEVMEG